MSERLGEPALLITAIEDAQWCGGVARLQLRSGDCVYVRYFTPEVIAAAHARLGRLLADLGTVEQFQKRWQAR